MNQTNQLSVKQAVLWFSLYQIGSMFLVVPRFLTQMARQDGWISPPVAVAMQLIIIPLFMMLIRQFKGKTFNEYIEMILGKWIGKIVLFIFTIMFPYFMFINALRNLTDYITTSVMTETPAEPLAVMMLIAVICIVRSGVSVIGRFAEIIFFPLLVIFLVNTAAFVLDAQYANILPILEYGIGPVFKGSYLLFANPYLESILFLFLLGNMTRPEKWGKVVMYSSLISGTTYTSVTLVSIVILGAGAVANLTFPTYFIVRTISLGDFFERFEIIVSMYFYLSIFFRLTLLLYVTAKNLTSIFELKDYRSLLIPLSLIAISLQKDLWSNIVESQDLLKTTPTIHGTLFGLILPCILCAIGAIRGKKKQL